MAADGLVQEASKPPPEAINNLTFFVRTFRFVIFGIGRPIEIREILDAHREQYN